eukprot:1187423-Prorocentrum_minimum.AAC.2
MVSDYQWFPIAPASSQEYNLDTRVGGPTVTFLDVIHWGAIDEKEHELRLTVDAGINGLRVVAGTIKIRYCGFPGETPCTDPNQLTTVHSSKPRYIQSRQRQLPSGSRQASKPEKVKTLFPPTDRLMM